mgnify:CR=1 FL=1
MNIVSLKAEAREGAGSRVADRIRSAGRIPANLFGAGQSSENLTVNAKDVERALKERRVEYMLELGDRREQVALRDVDRIVAHAIACEATLA